MKEIEKIRVVGYTTPFPLLNSVAWEIVYHLSLDYTQDARLYKPDSITRTIKVYHQEFGGSNWYEQEDVVALTFLEMLEEIAVGKKSIYAIRDTKQFLEASAVNIRWPGKIWPDNYLPL